VLKALQHKSWHRFPTVGQSFLSVIFNNAFPSEPIESCPYKKPPFLKSWLKNEFCYTTTRIFPRTPLNGSSPGGEPPFRLKPLDNGTFQIWESRLTWLQSLNPLRGVDLTLCCVENYGRTFFVQSPTLHDYTLFSEKWIYCWWLKDFSQRKSTAGGNFRLKVWCFDKKERLCKTAGRSHTHPSSTLRK